MTVNTAVTIRLEQQGDTPAVRKVNEKAFGRKTEANLADSLREACSNLLSMVAILDGHVVGHIMYSPVGIDSADPAVEGMGMGPVAVLPEYQRRGIGSRLIEESLERLRQQSCPFVVLAGHPSYYPRFGFEPASQHGLTCQWDGVPDEVFMVLIMDEHAMARVSGVARFRDEFDVALQETTDADEKND